MSYFADSMRFMDIQFEALFTKFNMLVPDPTSIARPLPSTGPPFPTRAPSSVPPPRPGVDGIDPEEAVPDDDDDDDKEMAEGAEGGKSGSDDDETESGSEFEIAPAKKK